jgi:uncharacterized membrane protein YqaE (UPF0057 family)
MLRIILALLLPPASVYLTKGFSSALIINIILTLIGWVPGIIHAFWILSKESENVNA